MAVADISVVPWYPVAGEEEGYAMVDEAIKVIQDSGLKYEVGAMSTSVEGSLPDILALVQKIHQIIFSLGGDRVLTTLRIDEKKSGPLTMESKVKKFR
jgi:uncharacterized protein (TIGR00106 family)